MDTRVLLLLFFLPCMLMAQESFSQDEKREYEQSIKKQALPAEILDSIEPFLQRELA
jgi:hypothetical protein